MSGLNDIMNYEDPFGQIRINNSPSYRSPFMDLRNIPVGKHRITDYPTSVFPSTGKNESGETKYEFVADVIACDDGANVLPTSEKYLPEKHELIVTYEKEKKGKSNLFGDFYISRMGSEFAQLITDWESQKESAINTEIGNKRYESISGLSGLIAYLDTVGVSKNGHAMNRDLLYSSLVKEYSIHTASGSAIEALTAWDEGIASAMEWCHDTLGKLLFVEKNYEAVQKDYDPLLPLQMVKPSNNPVIKLFKDTSENPFLKDANSVINYAKFLLEALLNKALEFGRKSLPDGLGVLAERVVNLIKNLKSTVEGAAQTISEVFNSIAEGAEEALKLYNAFICGVLNGLIGLVQLVFMLLEILFDMAGLDIGYKDELRRRDWAEKLESVIDFISEESGNLLDGIKALFAKTDGVGLSLLNSLVDGMVKVWDGISRYKISYWLGLLGFEVLINVLLAVFTGGMGNIAKATTYAEKIRASLQLVGREALSVGTMGLTDLMKFMRNFIRGFAEACKKGGIHGLLKWVDELLTKIRGGAHADDLVDQVVDLDDVLLKGKKLQKGGGDINKTFAENAGIKTEKWISETKVFGQSENNTCAATSLRMVLNDKKIARTEDELARALKTDADGASILDIPEALDFKRIDEITAIAQKDIKLSKLLENLEDGDKAIISIGTREFGSHAVVLEKEENGKVFLRDPLPMNRGTSYAMKIEDFKKIFKERAVIIKK